MPADNTYLPVNWIDGMKISRKHFEQTGLYTEELARDLAALPLTDYNFGILPGNRSLDMAVFFDSGQRIQIELKSCNAITPNGSRIQVHLTSNIQFTLNSKQ